MTDKIPEPPERLTKRDIWICWRLEDGDKKPVKPYGRGGLASSTDSSTWRSFEEAREYHENGSGRTDGVGFVFDEEDYLVGVDLDDVRDVETGEELEWATDVLESFDTYTERSPSGSGYHAICEGIKDGDKCKVEQPETLDGFEKSEIEMYDSGRFFTYTGERDERFSGNVELRNSTIEEVYAEYMADDGGNADETDETPAERPQLDLSDEQVIEKAKAAENGDTFDRLHRGDDSMHGGDTSRADLAYCGMLAFWTGGDKGQMDRIFRNSRRMRDKWDEDRGSQTYGEMTLEKALEGKSEFYDPDGSSDTPKPPEPDTSDTDGPQDLTDWWEYVNSCYNQDNGHGRKAAADGLEKVTDWMYVIESAKLWVYESDKGYFNPRGESYIRNLLERKLGANYSKQEASEVIERIQARNQTQRAELNARTRDAPLLCVGNGVVNLETGEVTDHSPEYKFTRGLKWDYDPANADPDAIVDFLDDITERKEDRDTLLDHLAHGLMPGHPYRAFVMMYGPGSNGKTRVGKLFRGFVGEENAASVELQDLTGDDSFATGGLPGAFINVGDDISVGEIRDTSIIKSLTGDGTIRANEKYEKQYEFENEAAMFFSANEPPRLSEKTDAINDRLYPIEMPYRFVDNPTEPMEKEKIPGIAEDLIRDDDAMRGLLVLTIKHAQEVIERRGAYSMPEGPAERREMYEAASDPIKRFAISHLQASDHSSVILKDDAYTVYTEMCEQQGERSASADVFKRKVGGLASIDVESTRTRKLSPGDDREQGWRYVEFAESAKQYVPQRLLSRYFGDDEETENHNDPDPQTPAEAAVSDSSSVYGATPIVNAAETLTGYVTVTAEVATTMSLGDDGCKAILKDESGAMDIVAWDQSPASWLSDAEGKAIVVHDAEVREYEGKRQLTFVDGLTELDTIQAGVGYSPGETPGQGQAMLESPQAAADGGQDATHEDTDEEAEDNMNRRQRARAAADALPKDWVPIKGAYDRIMDELDVDADSAGNVYEQAKTQFGFVEEDGRRARRID